MTMALSRMRNLYFLAGAGGLGLGEPSGRCDQNTWLQNAVIIVWLDLLLNKK